MQTSDILNLLENKRWKALFEQLKKDGDNTTKNDFYEAFNRWATSSSGFRHDTHISDAENWRDMHVTIGGNSWTEYKDSKNIIENIEKKLSELYEKLQETSNEEERNKILKEIDDNLEREARTKAEIDRRGGKYGAISDFVKEGVQQLKNIYNVVRDFNDPWAKIDDAASKYTKAIGQNTKQYENLRKNTINNVSKSRIAIDYNMSTEELIKAQQDYAVGAGRNISVSNEDQENLAAMTAIYGGKANELAVLFEKFGVGLTDTSEHLGDMFNKAAKSGISLEKYTDNVKKGLAMAQTYTFAGGLKSMERMAQHAAKIHMDMEQVRALADKTGNVEGAITTAARMQVLGGPFASMADPLGMLSESWGDMEGLLDRMSKITATIGHFNKMTGEVKVDAFDKQRLRAYAEATGQDYSQVMETVHQQAKLGEIRSQINSSSAAGLSKEMKELIENTATFKDGRAGVTIDGEFKTLDQLKETDKKELEKLQQTEAQDIKQIARDVASLKDKREGLSKQWENAKSWISEHFKIGQTEKGGLNWVGQRSGLLKLLAGGSLLLAFSGAITKAFRTFFPKTRRLGDYAPNMEGWVGKAPRGILGKGNKQAVKTITKGGNTFNPATGVITNSKGKPLSGAAADSAAGKFGLKTGEYARTKAEQKIFERTSKQATKKGIGFAFTKVGAARKGAEKALTKSVGKVLGKNAYKGLLKAGPKIMKAGGIAGAVGLGLHFAEHAALSNGRMKKGGAEHTALHIGSKAAEFAGWGTLLGPVGTIAGAALGTIVGSVQMAKIKREMGLDNKLTQMGIERKGDYGAKKLKKIDKALTTGKISRKVRRKMEREGDFEMLAQIDAIKEQKREEKVAKREAKKETRHTKKEERRQYKIDKAKAKHGGEMLKQIKQATFHVDVANFTGNAFGGNIKTSNKKRATELKISPFDKLKEKTLTGIKTFPSVSIASAPQEKLASTIKILSNIGGGLSNTLKQQNNKIEPIDININGTLKLEGKGGQTVDIIDMLKKDNRLLQSIVNLLSPKIEDEITKRQNGGGGKPINRSQGDNSRQ